MADQVTEIHRALSQCAHSCAHTTVHALIVLRLHERGISHHPGRLFLYQTNDPDLRTHVDQVFETAQRLAQKIEPTLYPLVSQDSNSSAVTRAPPLVS
ncbi:hypothetical protein MMC22_002185 [Lobaria immixta]|nr:hypothetical protein [Lobaria immixta]